MSDKKMEERMQVTREKDMENSCPLCNIPEHEVLADFPRWRLARTKTMKGHKERLMIYYKEHAKSLDEQSVGEAHMILMTMGQKFFSYAKQWAVFEPVFATVPEHWHRVASDLNPASEDHEQILKTPRLVVETDQMTISRVKPEPPEELETPSPTDHQCKVRSSGLRSQER
jgi:hypothetical protein